MGVAIVTGSGGLIGSESVRYFAEQGFDVIGVENDMRAQFFGAEASTAPTSARLAEEVEGFHSEPLDIRDADGIMSLFGTRVDPATGARNALRAIGAIWDAIDGISRDLAGELDRPLGPSRPVGMQQSPAFIDPAPRQKFGRRRRNRGRHGDNRQRNPDR